MCREDGDGCDGANKNGEKSHGGGLGNRGGLDAVRLGNADKLGQLRKHPNEDVPAPKLNKPSSGMAEQILGNKYTPVAAAAVQVLSGTTFDFALPFAETPVGLIVTIGAFIVNRASSLLGLGSTFYQYKHQLNGTNFTDVVVSGTTFTLGWVPPLIEPMAIGSLIYSGVRLDHDAPIYIPAPPFLTESLR